MTAHFFFEVERDAFKRLTEVLAVICIDNCVSCACVLKAVIYIILQQRSSRSDTEEEKGM